MPAFTGIAHLALTVTDLERSVAFYGRLWGMASSGTLDGPALHRWVFLLPDGTTIGLTRHDATASTPFDAHARGLDHVGFAVANLADLQAWADHLTAMDIAHSGLVEADYGTALSFTDPDGIALEFFVASTAT